MAIHQPHDRLFKRVFGAPAEAASFLQARLPASLSHSLHWPTLKRLPASFVAPDLRGTASDLLFEIGYAAPGAAQAPLWLYLLFEHQSTPDYWLRLRLLGYCCRIWEHDRRDHQDAGYLRPILPLVFYQGPTGWQHSPQFADLFPAATRDWPWLPRFEHVLFDQTQMSPAQAAGSVRARLLQLTMMHAFNRAVREARARMRPLFDARRPSGDDRRFPAGRRRLVDDRAGDRDRRAGVSEAQEPTQRRGRGRRRRDLTTRPRISVTPQFSSGRYG